MKQKIIPFIQMPGIVILTILSFWIFIGASLLFGIIRAFT